MENIPKLVTHEDSFHIHKTFGAISLLHYLYRFKQLLYTGNMGFTPVSAIGWALFHSFLSLSSFFFAVPRNRIKTKPMIYREFRLHSIFFGCRSFLGMILWALSCPKWANIVVVFSTMIAADICTLYYKKLDTTQGSTMRDMPFPDSVSENKKYFINLFYSISQVFATLSILYNDNDTPDRIFLIAFPIQIAAFLMTLVRKSIISACSWHIAYAFSLSLGYIRGIALIRTTHRFPLFWISFLFFTFFRFRYKVNKYLLWTVICLFYFVREP